MTAPPSHPSEDRSPVTLVQLSDLHLCTGEDGRGPAARLEHAIRRVAALQPRPRALLLSGDLADTPSSAAYEQAHELLAPLGLPMHAIPGNHDYRDDDRVRRAPTAHLPEHELSGLP
jgi:3',5'-cyclic AMP phosphodiesterase CpdA